MTTPPADRNPDGTPRHAADIEADIARTRDEIGRTLDALKRHLAPRHLMEQGLNRVWDGLGAQTARIVEATGDTIRQHPGKLSLASAALGGLFWWGIGRDRPPAADEPRPDAPAKPGTGNRLADLMADHPLAVGGAALAAGILLAMTLPTTGAAAETIGDSDEAQDPTDRAQRMATAATEDIGLDPTPTSAVPESARRAAPAG
ncbi:MAG TPA: DUF3618 domain-containing protein [Stellaceae bacterium]|nr:DUF3618 domain-containing protein [Stellaceae bacterium]